MKDTVKILIFNKSGFTFIELLCSIVIISIIILVAVPNVTKLVDSGEKEVYSVQEEMIVKAAKLYKTNCSTKNVCVFTETADKSIIDINDLIKYDYISPIKVNDKDCSGKVEIINGKYEVKLEC